MMGIGEVVCVHVHWDFLLAHQKTGKHAWHLGHIYIADFEFGLKGFQGKNLVSLTLKTIHSFELTCFLVKTIDIVVAMYSSLALS